MRNEKTPRDRGNKGGRKGPSLGFRVWGLGFKVWGSGFGVKQRRKDRTRSKQEAGNTTKPSQQPSVFETAKREPNTNTNYSQLMLITVN